MFFYILLYVYTYIQQGKNQNYYNFFQKAQKGPNMADFRAKKSDYFMKLLQKVLAGFRFVISAVQGPKKD